MGPSDPSRDSEILRRALQDQLEAQMRLALLRAELSIEEMRLTMVTAWVLVLWTIG